VQLSRDLIFEDFSGDAIPVSWNAEYKGSQDRTAFFRDSTLGSCSRILRSKSGLRDIKLPAAGAIASTPGGSAMVVTRTSEYYLLGQMRGKVNGNGE
jgi:hypothetical protein